MTRIIGSSILIYALLIAGCASTGATGWGDRSYEVEADELMDLLDATLANMGIEIEGLGRVDEETYSVVARQSNSAARSGGTNVPPSMNTLQILVRSTSPTTSSISINVPRGDYGSASGAQLRQRVLRALDRRVESSL